MPRLIPCLDVREGRVVKGRQFRDLRDAGDPAALAARYRAAGADELVVLDVSATLESRAARAATIEAVRAVLDIPLTVGGGVRSVADVEALLAAGADKVAVNTAAVESPLLVDELARRFGSQCIVVSIDACRRDGQPLVVTRSGTQVGRRRAEEWASEVVARGAGEILLTSQDRDGTRSGYDLDLIALVRARVGVPVIASGGAATVAHLCAALAAGADAVLAASIFHDGELGIVEVKAALAAAGWELRR